MSNDLVMAACQDGLGLHADSEQNLLAPLNSDLVPCSCYHLPN